MTSCIFAATESRCQTLCERDEDAFLSSTLQRLETGVLELGTRRLLTNLLRATRAYKVMTS